MSVALCCCKDDCLRLWLSLSTGAIPYQVEAKSIHGLAGLSRPPRLMLGGVQVCTENEYSERALATISHPLLCSFVMLQLASLMPFLLPDAFDRKYLSGEICSVRAARYWQLQEPNLQAKRGFQPHPASEERGRQRRCQSAPIHTLD